MLYQYINSITFKNSHIFCYIDIEDIYTISTFYFRNIRNIKIWFLSQIKIFKILGGGIGWFSEDNIMENHPYNRNREIKIKIDNTVKNNLSYMFII